MRFNKMRKTNIFPAIDVSGGRVVRLLNGDYDRKTVYGESPLETAKSFERDGAVFIHMVDLDGARDGDMPAFTSVSEIASGTGLKVEIGGGIRSEDRIKRYIDAGAHRVILGTAAVTDPDFTAKMLSKFGKRIAVGIDVRDGYPAIKGWRTLGRERYENVFRRVCEVGAETIICTDISKDGALAGIDVGFYEKLIADYTDIYGCGIVASGGVTDADDVRRLSGIGLEGIIIGRALYDGNIVLREVLR